MIDQDTYFMQIAKAVAIKSPCLNRQVGCILIGKHNQILSTGYNGPPRKVPHCVECTRKHPSRDLYSCAAVHAEINALLQCPTVEAIEKVYVTVNPCNVCMRLLANTSAKEVIVNGMYTKDSFSEFLKFWVTGLGRVAAILDK